MVINNANTLRMMHDEAGWRPGDDSQPIYRRFVARMRDIAADENAAPVIRQRAHEDLVSLAHRR